MHHVDFGGPVGGPRLVLVHGLGGSHLNWWLLAPLLRHRARVHALDLPGFGYSPPAGRSATVEANAEVLHRFVEEVAGGPVILVGNSMGGTIGLLTAAAHPEAVSGLVLLDPSLPPAPPFMIDPAVAGAILALATPGLNGRALAGRRRWMDARTVVRQTLQLCGLDEHAVPDGFVEETVAMVEARRSVPGADRAVLEAGRSLVRLGVRVHRYWAVTRAVPAPVLLVHGDRDRLVPVAAARRAAARNPHWRTEVLPGVGHVPQLQVPGRTAELVLDWLEREGAAAGRRAAQARQPASSTPPGTGAAGS
ncbi:alpha/beta hydrolase [Pseudonocardia sp. K10HN5]|uniref:Alpha/beta hydrolase n=1 Tax=Pseudonocardia acidicola TaxID=2724939 RepID=A0ABX1S2J7_9PSEU|nr:alpha/beta hydrolase [Pseudonocardia acidicola]